MDDKWGGSVRAEMTSLDVEADCPGSITLSVRSDQTLPSSVTLSLHSDQTSLNDQKRPKEQKSRRNKRQTSSLRIKKSKMQRRRGDSITVQKREDFLPVQRKGDSLPVQQCQQADPFSKNENPTMAGGVDVNDNKYKDNGDETEKGKDKKSAQDLKRAKGFIVATGVAFSQGATSSSKEMFESKIEMASLATGKEEKSGQAVVDKGVSSFMGTSVHDIELPQEIFLSKSEMESLSTEKSLLDMEVRGPPTDRFEVNELTKNWASMEEEVEEKETQSLAVSSKGKSKESSGKKAKEERNLLSANTTGVNAKNNGLVDTKEDVEAKDTTTKPTKGDIDEGSDDDTKPGALLNNPGAEIQQSNMKTKTTATMKAQQAKWEMLNKDPVAEKSDAEKETTPERTAEGDDTGSHAAARIQVLWMKGTETEQRLKQINQDGVTCYNDNRLMEERENDETMSKQRLDPNAQEQLEKTDSMSEKLSLALQVNQQTLDNKTEDKQEASTAPNELSKDDAHSNTSHSSDTSHQDSADNLRHRLLHPSEKSGSTLRQMTENSVTSLDIWTDYSTGSNEPTEDSWNETFCSFESGHHLDVPAMDDQPALRHELSRLPLFSKVGYPKRNVRAVTCPQMTVKAVQEPPKFESGSYHFSRSTMVSWIMKTVKDQINHMSQGQRSTNSLKKDNSFEEQKLDHDEDNESDNFEEKYKDEDTEKESISYTEKRIETEMEGKTGQEDKTGQGDTEQAGEVDSAASEADQLEETWEAVLDNGDICSSLRIYSLPRKQEVEEMRRALKLFNSKIKVYSSKLETGLENLKRLNGLLSRPRHDDQGPNNHKHQPDTHYSQMGVFPSKPWVEPFKRQAQSQPTCGCVKGRPPNPPRKQPRVGHGSWRQNDIYMPEKGQSRRRLEGFRGHNFGRKCSGSDGGGGSYSQGSSSGSSKHDSTGDSDGNYDGGPGGSDNNNNNNNNNNERGGDGGSGRPSPRSPGDTDVPPFDPKKYRKKHFKMDTASCSEFLGALKLKTQTGPRWQNLLDDQSAVWCVSTCLSSPDELSAEMMSCLVCVSLNSLLKHYADCSATYSACDMCTQIFSLICAHVADCMNNNRGENENEEGDCNIKLCMNIVRLMEGSEIEAHVKSLWFHVRKKLARIIGTCEEDQDLFLGGMTLGPGTALDAMSARINSGSQISSIGSKLQSIPENSVAPTVLSPSNSRVLVRKKSSLSKVPEDAEASSETGESENENEDKRVQSLPTNTTGVETVYTRGETTGADEGDHGAGPASTGESSSGGGASGGDRPDNAGFRIQSMPMGPRPGYQENYFPSITFSPMGVKGIGEVVYGDRAMLVVVADYWLSLKRRYSEAGKLSPQYREEGVILREFKPKLKVQGLRYNQQFQWVKKAPLGNGMSGKCHLAEDFETDFKFCVKEIHISNYEKEEIELWSELEHTNIVKIYGAIRFREDIYILQELVEGGSLTEAINTQKLLGRRLSQVTALAYFKQLLNVLIHLKAKHIMHEDLKADNILLKQDKGEVYIKVADFGLARRCPDRMREGTRPVGTQTQWSPEKSEGTGYGFPAEVWAAVCVLVHILSGYPPWIQRFEHALKSLMFVIVKQSPPVEDIPRNINEQLRDLIQRGFTVCQNTRPQAAKLLRHPAFRLLDEQSNGKTTSILYSNLPPTNHPSLDLNDNPNADLLEIIENLNKETKPGFVPEPPSTYTVFPVYNAPQNGAPTQNGISMPPSGTFSVAPNGASSLEIGVPTQGGMPPPQIGTPPVEVGGPPDHIRVSPQEYPDNAGDRTHTLDRSAMDLLRRFDEEYNTGAAGPTGGLTVDRHVVDQYLHDHDPGATRSRPTPGIDLSHLTIYDPNSEQFATQQRQNNKAQASKTPDGKSLNIQQPSSLMNVSSTEETIMKEVLPDFVKLGIEDCSNVDEDDEEDEEEPENMFANFVLENAIPNIVKSFSQPELSSEGMESPNTSRRERSEGSLAVHVVFDEVYNTIQDDDELFMSGPIDEQVEPAGPSHLVRIPLTKVNGSRDLFVVNPTSDQSQSRSPSSSASTIDQRYSFTPYLVPPDNSSRHSTPQKGVFQSTPSPEAGPGEAKRLRFDTSTPINSPIPRRTDLVDQRKEDHERNAGALNPEEVLYSRETRQHQTPSSWRPIDHVEGNNPTALQLHSPAASGSNNPGHGSPVHGRMSQAATGRSRKAAIDDLNQQRKKTLVGQSSQAGVGHSSTAPKLVLDVDIAQQGAATPATQAQTAPVFSPPRDQPELKRLQSERAAPSQGSNTSQTLHKTPSTTSTSQYDQQENAFRELELAMSEHSDPSYLLHEDPDDDEPHGEFDIDLENPEASISHYLNQSPTDAIKVTFRNRHLGKEITVKFPIKSKSLTWEKILDEEFSRHTELYANSMRRICVTFEDGTQLDLGETLGEASVTVLVEEAVSEERWWMENGVLMNTHARPEPSSL